MTAVTPVKIPATCQEASQFYCSQNGRFKLLQGKLQNGTKELSLDFFYQRVKDSAIKTATLAELLDKSYAHYQQVMEEWAAVQETLDVLQKGYTLFTEANPTIPANGEDLQSWAQQVESVKKLVGDAQVYLKTMRTEGDTFAYKLGIMQGTGCAASWIGKEDGYFFDKNLEAFRSKAAHQSKAS